MKVVKIRKTHKCSYCERDRPIGTLMGFYQGRSGKFIDGSGLVENDEQIGIEYWKNYLCHEDVNCVEPKS
jgi:hypothetical protein